MRIEDMFPDIFVINLEARKDRLAECVDEFKALGVNPRRLKAVENENPVTGCRDSHLALLRYASAMKHNIMIFEDDVHFIGDFKETISSALDEISTMDWDMLYLGGNVLNNIYQETDHLGRLTHCQSTVAYAINYNFVDKLIPAVENFGDHIDILYAWGIVPNNKCYITVPMTVIQRPSYSDIMKQNVDYSYTIDRFNQYLVRKQWTNTLQ